jgi:hypothetical protein
MKLEAAVVSELEGFHLSHDRHWVIDTPEFSGAITDYNWELTGYDKKLVEAFPDVFRYGGNAYYIIYTWVPRMGFSVTQTERR